MQVPSQHKLNAAQLNLVKSFQFLRSEQEIDEIDSVNFYLEKKLDEAIERTESERNYSAQVYQQVVKQQEPLSCL